MFYKFKRGKQKQLIEKAITLAGSERKLNKITKIPKSSIHALKFEKRNLSDNYAKKLCIFLGINVTELDYSDELNDNWGQIKGGKNLIAKKKGDGTFLDTIDRLRKVSSDRMKSWHKNMKIENPKEYYIWQYERFKKVGKGYCDRLNNNISVRNELEKKIGNYLIFLGIPFDYEPYLNINGKVYFPDYQIKNKIIEVTGWLHPNKDRIKYLKKKLRDYQESGFEVVFYVPRNIRKFYKEINDSVISALPELKAFLMPL